MNEELLRKQKEQAKKENLKFLVVFIIFIIACYFIISEVFARFTFLDDYEYDTDILGERLANEEINKDGNPYLLTYYRLKDKENNIEKIYKYINHTDLFNYEAEVTEKIGDSIRITKEVRKGNTLYIYDENNKLINRKIFFNSVLFFPVDDNMSISSSSIAYPTHEHFVLYNRKDNNYYRSINGLVMQKLCKVRVDYVVPIDHLAEIEYDYPLLDEGIYDPVIYKHVVFQNGLIKGAALGDIFYSKVKKIIKEDNKITMKIETRKTNVKNKYTYKRYGNSEYVYERKSSLLSR